MTAPSTPLKQQKNQNTQSVGLMTPASGRVYEVDDSPSKRHHQSPKYVEIENLSLTHRTWPTPIKSELFRNRKERNVVKSSFGELDSSICDENAITVEIINIQINPAVGEQSQECDFLF